MKVSEVMTQNPRVIKHNQSALAAAQVLKEQAIGMLPVEKDDRLIGVLTDRDIVVRVVADQRGASDTPVEAVISTEVKYCFDDEEVDHVAQNMNELGVRRLPVVDRDKHLVGVVSIEDIRSARKL